MYLPSHSVIMSRLFIWQNRTIKPTAKGFIRQNRLIIPFGGYKLCPTDGLAWVASTVFSAIMRLLDIKEFIWSRRIR